MKKETNQQSLLLVGIIGLAALVLGFAGYSLAYSDKIMPGVSFGSLHLGGLTQEEAQAKLEAQVVTLAEQGIVISINDKNEDIALEAIAFELPTETIIEEAWNLGRQGSWYARMGDRLVSPLVGYEIQEPVRLNDFQLEQELEAVASILGAPRKDVRLQITGTKVSILYDTKSGMTIDIEQAKDRIKEALSSLDAQPVRLTLYEDVPRANPQSAPGAKLEAERMISQPLILYSDDERFVISRDKLATWIKSTYTGDALEAGIDEKAISAYITEVASKINILAQRPKIEIIDGKVNSFIPPRPGQVLEEEKTIKLIIQTLQARQTQPVARTQELTLPIKISKPAFGEADNLSGITELIGKATTRFTGSPANRISNIKNGVRFLTGIIIKPGEEFSTLQALGTIDNTTGYLPELVIKGDKTTPEFGGGLCQVSTTLFRAVLNTGLPITARRNHSYRVSYYENDGAGRYIGPGLDATIYSPNPDFKFKNDTTAPIVIIGSVTGDRLTFELYGTGDGRTAEIKGPVLLSEVAAGPPIYVETDTLAPGVVKQIETAHPGGTTRATYIITYADGKKVSQEFRSSYRRWPARYLVGRSLMDVIPGSPTPNP